MSCFTVALPSSSYRDHGRRRNREARLLCRMERRLASGVARRDRLMPFMLAIIFLARQAKSLEHRRIAGREQHAILIRRILMLVPGIGRHDEEIALSPIDP